MTKSYNRLKYFVLTCLLMAVFPAEASCTIHTPLLEPASFVSDTSYQLAKTCFLPDCSYVFNSRDYEVSDRPDYQPPDASRSCEGYGFLSEPPEFYTCDTIRPDNVKLCYRNCVPDPDKLCPSLGYEKVCPDGWAMSEERCPYDDSFAKCCNLCSDYPHETIPDGYDESASCSGCDGVRYQIVPHDCPDEFVECEYGPALDAEICQSGETLKYNSCKKCPFNCSLTSCPPNNICEREDCSGFYCAVGCALNAVDLETYWCNGAAGCLVPVGNITPETGCPSGQINTEAWCGGALGCVMKL